MNALLTTRDLTMAFGGVTALDKVNFAISERELRCIIGPNGAGKSTFFKCITGQIVPLRGAITFEDRSLIGLESHRVARLGIGIKMQVPLLFDGLSVKENVWLAARTKHGALRAKNAAERVLEQVRITYLASREVGHLAHGQRQLVELAMVLSGEPKLILLDEPAAGMSQEESAWLAEIIEEVNRTAAVVVIEHDMQFVRRIAKTITVFNQGAILIEDKSDVVLRDSAVREIYLGKQGNALNA